MTNFATQFNFEFSSQDNFEYPTGESLTVPNQVLTPKEMLDRFTRGLPLDQTSRTPYYSDIELPVLEKLDLTELHEMYQDNKKQLDEHEAREKAAKQKADKEAFKKSVIEDHEKSKSSTPPPTPPTPTTT